MVSDNSRDHKQPLESIINQCQRFLSDPWQYCPQTLTWSSPEALIIDQYGLCLGGSMNQVGHSQKSNLANVPLLISNILLLCLRQVYLAAWQVVGELSLYKFQVVAHYLCVYQPQYSFTPVTSCLPCDMYHSTPPSFLLHIAVGSHSVSHSVPFHPNNLHVNVYYN